MTLHKLKSTKWNVVDYCFKFSIPQRFFFHTKEKELRKKNEVEILWCLFLSACSLRKCNLFVMLILLTLAPNFFFSLSLLISKYLSFLILRRRLIPYVWQEQQKRPAAVEFLFLIVIFTFWWWWFFFLVMLEFLFLIVKNRNAYKTGIFGRILIVDFK